MPLTEESDEDVASNSPRDETSKRRRKRKRKKKAAVDDEEDDNAKGDDDAAEKVHTNVDGDKKKATELDRTVFVEGIPFSCTQDDVKTFFVSNGVDDIEDIRLPRWPDSGRLRGYGHVVFESDTSREKAIKELNGKHLQNRYLNIQAAKQRSVTSAATPSTTAEPNNNPSKTIMLNNLSYEAEEVDIVKVLERYGTIVDGGVRVVRHSQTGRSKGFAYVEFDNLNAAMRVVSDANKIEIQSRRCRVEYDHGRVKGSFRTADHKLWHKEYGRLAPAGGSSKRTKPSSSHED
jgi:nucleolin